MLARVPPPRTLGVMLSLALGACSSDEGFGGSTGAFCTDAGRLECCVGGCFGVTVAAPICDASGWQCPGGSVLRASCPDPRFCTGPVCDTPPAFRCCQGGCDGQMTAPPMCTSTGWACPDGYVSSDLCPGRFCSGRLGPPVLRSPTGPMDGPFGSE